MRKLRLTLDLQLFGQEKTEKATPKKRQDSRKKGEVAKSAELPGAFILLTGFLTFMMFGGFYKERISNIFSVIFIEYLGRDITSESVLLLFGDLILQGCILLAPVFIASILIAFVGNYIQIGFLFTGEPLMLKLSKINPLEGAKRIFSMRSLIEFLKSLLKLLVIGLLAYMALWNQRDKIIGLSSLPIENIFSFAGRLTVSLGVQIGVALVILAVFDYIYQRYEFEKKLKMSKQDIKDEYKKSEGDPLIKGKIKEKQRRMAMQRMMQEVPKADVVITNPTHFAIALQYDATKMEAPIVIAKGQDYVALKIKQIAKEHEIITIENKPLARALFDQTDLGQSVPAQLFQAVAEVLAYVYRLKKK